MNASQAEEAADRGSAAAVAQGAPESQGQHSQQRGAAAEVVAATAFSFAPWYLFTGAGVGGEYAAINSAIDELLFGVKAEQAELEDIAQPLTAEEAEEGGGEEEKGGEEEQAEGDAEGEGVDEGTLERERRIAERAGRRHREARASLRRFRPGPGSITASPALSLVGDGSSDERALDSEIEIVARALEEHGPTRRHDLARMVGARYWGPGRFPAAVREAIAEGRARRVSRSTLGPPHGDADG